MKEFFEAAPAIVAQAENRSVIGKEIALLGRKMRILRERRGCLKNLLWPEACHAKSSGATAEVYAEEIAICELMGAEGDWSFENWKRHGGCAEPGFDNDPESWWDFHTWRFGSHIRKRIELEKKIAELEAKLLEFRVQYGLLLRIVRKDSKKGG